MGANRVSTSQPPIYATRPNRSILLHEPSVFQFDIYASEQDVVKPNRLFDELWKQQVDYAS
jgi:hypothetical protein